MAIERRSLDVDIYGAQVVPCSITSGWTQCNRAGTSIGTNNANIVVGSPSYMAGDGNNMGFRYLNRRLGNGTNLRVRCRYPYGAGSNTVTTNPTYRVYGRKQPAADDGTTANEWQLLPNRDGETTCTLTCNTSTDAILVNDDTDNSCYASTSDIDANTHDCDGCDEFWIVIVTGMVMGVGTVANAVLEAKII